MIRPTETEVRRRRGYFYFARAFPDFMEEIRAMREHKRRVYERLQNASRPRQHEMARHILRHSNFQLVYAFETFRDLRRLINARPEAIRELAATFNPFDWIASDPIDNRTIMVGSRPREIISFGPKRRMHQKFVAEMLRHLHPPRDNQFLFNGGMPMAQQAIEAAITEGYEYGAELDFENFYNSVRPLECVELLRPLPNAVIENVIHDYGLRDQWSYTRLSVEHPDYDSPPAALNGLTGLPLGSASSPIVAERVVAHFLADDLPGRVITYADNLFVLGRTMEEMNARKQALMESVSRSEVGPLRLREVNTSRLRDGFTFLHQNAEVTDDGIRWSPDERKRDQYQVLRDDVTLSDDELTQLETKISYWRRAYPSWQDGDMWLLMRKMETAVLRYYRAGDVPHLVAAAQALVYFYLVRRGEMDFIDDLPEPIGVEQVTRRGKLMDEFERMINSLNLLGQDEAIAA